MSGGFSTARKQRLTVLSLLLLILITLTVGVGIGDAAVRINRVIPVLLGEGSFKEELVLFSIRLPRMAITLLAGMALALSGTILQSITRNALADPGLIGINAGAGLAVAIFFLYVPVQAEAYAYLMPTVGFLGGLAAAAMICWAGYSRTEGLNPGRMVLVGIGVSLALAGTMIVIVTSADRTQFDVIAQWLAGNIWGTAWPYAAALLPWLLVLFPYVLYKSNALNLLALSEEVTLGAGVAVRKDRPVLLLAAVALAASAVSVTGGIAFVGLMAPHIAKALSGPRHQAHVPVAMLLGGWLLLAADMAGRQLADPAGIPAGVMVSLIGAPYFAFLLLKNRKAAAKG